MFSLFVIGTWGGGAPFHWNRLEVILGVVFFFPRCACLCSARPKPILPSLSDMQAKLAGLDKKMEIAEAGRVLTIGDGIARVYGLRKVRAFCLARGGGRPGA